VGEGRRGDERHISLGKGDRFWRYLVMQIRKRHVAEGAEKIAKEEAKLSKYEQEGRKSEISQKFLATLQSEQRRRERTRDGLRKELDQLPPQSN
jgi:hypothetical protein